MSPSPFLLLFSQGKQPLQTPTGVLIHGMVRAIHETNHAR